MAVVGSENFELVSQIVNLRIQRQGNRLNTNNSKNQSSKQVEVIPVFCKFSVKYVFNGKKKENWKNYKSNFRDRYILCYLQNVSLLFWRYETYENFVSDGKLSIFD